MVSFRNSQLQAMIVGLVIADAVSQGQLSWASPGQLAVQPEAGHWATVAIADDGWSQTIANQLNQLSQADIIATQSTLMVADESDSNSSDLSTVSDLLVYLPRLLERLDVLSLISAIPHAESERARIAWSLAAFYDCLRACLRQDIVALDNLQHQLQLAPSVSLSQAGLCQAIKFVLAAQGDFQLAVGQSLQAPNTVVGVPILVGMLSAGWGALPSLPTRYRHELNQPSPTLQVWLQHRWQITSGQALDLWTASLWQRWSGQYRLTPGRSQQLAVLPRTINVDRGEL